MLSRRLIMVSEEIMSREMNNSADSSRQGMTCFHETQCLIQPAAWTRTAQCL